MKDVEPLPQKEKPVAVMSIKRNGRDIKIGLYLPHNVDYPRPFIPRELGGEGGVFELDLDEQVMGEILYLRKPTAETLERLRVINTKNNSIKRR